MPVMDNYTFVDPESIPEARERLFAAKEKKANVELQLATKDKDDSVRYRSWRARALYSRRVSEQEIANLRRWLQSQSAISRQRALS